MTDNEGVQVSHAIERAIKNRMAQLAAEGRPMSQKEIGRLAGWSEFRTSRLVSGKTPWRIQEIVEVEVVLDWRGQLLRAAGLTDCPGGTLLEMVAGDPLLSHGAKQVLSTIIREAYAGVLDL